MEKVSVEYAGQLIMKAIESGAIKLIGPVAPSNAKRNAGADAAYIKELIKQLTEATATVPSDD